MVELRWYQREAVDFCCVFGIIKQAAWTLLRSSRFNQIPRLGAKHGCFNNTLPKTSVNYLLMGGCFFVPFAIMLLATGRL